MLPILCDLNIPNKFTITFVHFGNSLFEALNWYYIGKLKMKSI